VGVLPVDEAYLLATVRNVERNPVAARLCTRPEPWPWSSTAAHLRRCEDKQVVIRPMLSLADDWAAFLPDVSDDGIGYASPRTPTLVDHRVMRGSLTLSNRLSTGY
jgi:hypothetical protein